MRLPFLRLLIFFCLLSQFLTLTARAQSNSQQSATLEDALSQLADRFASTSSAHGGFWRVAFFSYAPLAAESPKEWQDFFRQQLESHHFVLTEDPTAPLLRVGIAQTPTELVFSAAIHVGEKDEVRLLTFPRATFRAASLPVVPVRFEKQLIFQSTDALLDAAFWSPTSAGIAVLADHNGQLAVLHVEPPTSVERSVLLNAAGPLLSRELEGELAWRQGSLSALVAGKSCEVTWAASAEPKCQAAKILPRPAVLTPPCGGAWKLVADGADWTRPEFLQAVPNDSMQKGSAAIVSDFPGPIININSGENPSASALVVTRNLRTGIYEVYNVTLACGN